MFGTLNRRKEHPTKEDPARGMTVAPPMCMVDHTNDMEPGESDKHSIWDHCHLPHCHKEDTVVIVTWCLPGTILFQAFPINLTNLTKQMAAAKWQEEPT